MYRVTANIDGEELPIYNRYHVSEPDNYSFVILDPKLVMEDSNAGSFDFTLPVGNVGYSLIERMTTEITVHRSTKTGWDILWQGRVIQETCDFYNNRKLSCEGVLAYLNDSIQPQNAYSNVTYATYLEALLNIHNQQVAGSFKEIQLGIVDVTGTIDYIYTEYDNTLAYVNDLAEIAGAHLYIRWDNNGVRRLDLIENSPRTNNQTISLGKNLLDFTKNYDMTNFCTALLPIGACLTEPSYYDDESSEETRTLDEYVTIKDVNEGSLFIQNTDAVEAYGWICRKMEYSDIYDSTELLSLAEDYLLNEQFENMTLEVKIIDLQIVNKELDYIALLDDVRVVSNYHGLDRIFPVNKVEIPLDNPENTTLTLGSESEISLTTVNNQLNAALLDAIDKQPSMSTILMSAQDQAKQLIESRSKGYITFVNDADGNLAEMYITQVPDYRQADKYWRWNYGGLGYFDGTTYRAAITMDGKIHADMITTGYMLADRVLGGTLRLGAYDNQNGVLQIFDDQGVLIGSWDATGFRSILGNDTFYINDACARGYAGDGETGLLDLSAFYENENGETEYNCVLRATETDLALQARRNVRLEVYDYSEQVYKPIITIDRYGIHFDDDIVDASATGSFRTSDNKTVRVKDGIITSIS